MVKSKAFQFFLHTIAWVLFFSLPLILWDKPQAAHHGNFPRPQSPGIMGLAITNLSLVAFFYLNYLLLFPQLFVRKKFLLYLLSLVGVTLLFFVLQDYARSFFTTPIMPGQNDFRPVRFGPGLFMFLLVTTLSTGIRITEELFKSEQRNKAIENDKLNAELSSLKSQINPHFLFNALNTIYSLTITESSKASEAVVNLSKLMRYVIQDSQGNTVPLKEEINHLEDFIEFQKLRTTQKLTVNYMKVIDNLDNCEIAPLILIPFIENAFKYGVSAHEDSTIAIDLLLENGLLSLNISNKIFLTKNISQANAGIGLNNTKRRLALIYPDKHQLETIEEQGTYAVALKINLA